MVTRPVLVVGIGRAGCTILSAVDEFVAGKDVEDHFQFLAIDSSSRDLQTFAPTAATTYELTIDRDAYDRDSDSLDYLQREHAFVPEAGTSRRRPLGRYLVDSVADSVQLYECLSDEITTLSKIQSRSPAIQVWVINSLGGGTGSGAFPLVSLLLQKCRQEMEETVEIFGIGSLPRLDRLQDQIDVPEGEPVHYANAYTALAELRRLMDLDGETTYPIEIDINSSPDDVRSTSLSTDRNPFEGYWLLGHNETDRFYAEDGSRMNLVATRLISYLASVDANDWFRQGNLYSITGVSVEAPIEELQQYYTLDRELDRLDDELGTLRNQRESILTATECIDSLVRASSHVSHNDGNETHISTQADDSLPIGEALISEYEDLVSAISGAPHSDSSRKDIFDERVQEIVERNREGVPDHVPPEPALEYFLSSLIREEIRQKIATHPLPDYLYTLQNKWLSGEIDERPQPEVVRDEGSFEESFQEWREALRTKLQNRLDDFRVRAANSLVPRIVSSSGQQLTELEGDLERADRFVTEYEKLRDFESYLTDQMERTRRQLKKHRRHLEKKAEDKKEEWEKTQQRVARLSQQRAQLKSSLKDLTQQGRRLRVPLRLEEDTGDSVLSNSNFTSLLTNGLLGKQELRKSFETAMTLLEEPVEDLTESRFGTTTGRLGIIAPDSDHGLLEELLVDGKDESASLQRELYYKFEDIDDIVSGKQVSSLYLLAFYSPVSLQYTSEFGTIHQHYTDPDSDVSSLLGSISDSDLRDRFAYPELLE